MPTPNGLFTPIELADAFLKDHGVEGYIHPGTGLLLPPSEEAEAIISKELDRADDVVQVVRTIRSFNDSGGKKRRS